MSEIILAEIKMKELNMEISRLKAELANSVRLGKIYFAELEATKAELAAAQTTIKEMTDDMSLTKKSCQEMHKKDREQLAAAREALAFYADPETYFAIGFFPDHPCGEFMDDIEEDTGDPMLPNKPGKRARKALGDKPTI